MILEEKFREEFNQLVSKYLTAPMEHGFHEETRFGPGGVCSLIIWDPLIQFEYELVCQKHPTTKLSRLTITDDVENANKNKNPR